MNKEAYCFQFQGIVLLEAYQNNTLQESYCNCKEWHPGIWTKCSLVHTEHTNSTSPKWDVELGDLGEKTENEYAQNRVCVFKTSNRSRETFTTGYDLERTNVHLGNSTLIGEIQLQ